jgi:dihydrofolate reductase
LLTELKNKEGKTIFCDGGSEIANQLLTDKLFDELILSIVPIIVGNGTRLFKEGIPEQELILKSVNHFEKGLVQLHYSFN